MSTGSRAAQRRASRVSDQQQARTWHQVSEPLEARLFLAVTPLTNGNEDHRWPSLNNSGDYVYSQQVGGVWQVFKNGQSLTGGPYNKMYPSISDDGSVVYFQEGGSGGVGWAVVRRSSGGSESMIEVSSRNALSGAHRDAHRYASIASNGTSISGYDFYSCSFCTATRRFNVGGVGQLSYDFGGFGGGISYPDVNASGDLLFASNGNIFKTGTSGPFPGPSVAPGTMARINDSDDLVTVDGNLNANGQIRLRTAPAYASTFVADGSWADINNERKVIYEATDQQGYRQLYLFTLDKPDVEVLSATRVTTGSFSGTVQAFDISYRVRAPRPDEFRVALYVSDDDHFDQSDTLLSPSAFTVLSEPQREPGDRTLRIDLGADVKSTLPPEFYLLAVVDDEKAIDERDEDNNDGEAMRCEYAEPFTADHGAASVTPANTCNFTRGRMSPVTEIIVHAITNSAQVGINEFRNVTFKSAHYIVDRGGAVTQMVPEADTAFHASGSNSRSVGIEHEDGGTAQSPGYRNNPGWATDALLRNSARLTADIARRHGVPIDRSHIRGHDEAVGEIRDPGPHWPWGKYMQLVSGAPGAFVPNVLLPGTEIQPQWPQKPGKGLYYAPLGVNFTAVEPLDGGLWSATSNVGTLEIYLKDFLGNEQFLVARSTGSATLTLFEPGAIMPGAGERSLTADVDPANHLLRWHTDGFQAQRLGVTVNIGPITLWVEPEDIGVAPSESVLFEQIVRTAEAYIHAKIVGDLSAIHSLGRIEDPGETTLLTTAPDGRRTGVLPGGEVVTEIPGSAYFASGPAVLIINPDTRQYVTRVTGTATGDILLLASTADLSESSQPPVVQSESLATSLSQGQSVHFGSTVSAAAGAPTLVALADVVRAGTASDDQFTLMLDPSGTVVRLYEGASNGGNGGLAYSAAFDSIARLRLDLLGGSDTLVIDFSNGNPVPTGGLEFIGGDGGGDRLVSRESVAGGRSLTIGNAVRLGGSEISTVGVEDVVLDALSADDSIALVDDAIAALTGTPMLSRLTVSGTARLRLGDLGHRVRTGMLAVEEGGRLDVAAGELIIAGGDEVEVSRLVASARNGGASGRWSGTGVTSSVAAGNPLMALAVARIGNDVHVKYTYDGDANLDGRINADDYFRIDSGFLEQPQDPTYAQGDFNYDNRINADDYFLIDSAFLGQGQPLAGEGDVTTAESAVTAAAPTVRAEPEPARKRPARPLFSDRPVGVLDASRRAGVARRR